MEERDLMEKIRRSADNIKIPDSLEPEQIERRLGEIEKRKRRGWQNRIVRFASLAAVLALALTGAGIYGQMKNPKQDAAEERTSETEMLKRSSQLSAVDQAVELTEMTAEEQAADTAEIAVQEQATETGAAVEDDEAVGYTVPASAEELYDRLKEYQEENRVVYAREEISSLLSLDSGAVEDTAQEDAALAQEPGAIAETEIAYEGETSSSDSGSSDYSQTNVREIGVDEGDVVKTDGSYLYILKSGSSVVIVDIQGDEMKQSSQIEPEQKNESIEEIYLTEDRLCLITSGTETSMEEQAEDVYTVDRRSYTALSVYDISDRTQPELLGRSTVEGSYYGSRRNGDYCYLLTEYQPSIGDTCDDSELMPLVNGEELEISDVCVPEQLQDLGYLVAAAVNLQEPDRLTDSKAIVSGVSECYVSGTAIYISNETWSSGETATQILKFTYGDGEIEAVGAGEVSGYLNDSFSMDEYQGYLRVLTTENSSEETNNLLILDEDLQIVGKISDLAEGETIRSARLMGDVGYFVTFRQTDPLFSVDLSDPEHPEVIGELKLSGFSAYLHAFGENLLLGIGYEADEDTGIQTGVKLSMFDTSDPGNVQEVAKYVLDDAGYLPGDSNYRAITVDAEKNLIGFVCDTEYLVFRYTEDEGFENVLTYTLESENYWDGQAECRGVYAGEYFYVINAGEVLRFDMEEDFALVEELELA